MNSSRVFYVIRLFCWTLVKLSLFFAFHNDSSPGSETQVTRSTRRDATIKSDRDSYREYV